MSKDAADLQVCEEITKALLELPGAALFKEPLTDKEDTYPRYSQIVKSPQDLGTILNRLRNNEYANQTAWAKDIDQVWQNAEIYNGKEAYVSQIARHMKKHCEKLKRKLAARKMSAWIKNIIEWKQKIDKLIYSPPAGSQLNFLPELPYSEPEYRPFSTQELDTLIEASRNYFSSTSKEKNEDLKCVANIIAPDCPNNEMEENVIVNVEDLSPKTLYALREFFRKKIPNYPM